MRANLHVILCFSPIGDPIRVRARRFPSLVNCVVIDWFQPWPEEALASVSKRFLDPIDLGTEEAKASVIGFMPYSFLAVEKESGKLPRERGAVQLHDAQVVPRADRALHVDARQAARGDERADHALRQRRRQAQDDAGVGRRSCRRR